MKKNSKNTLLEDLKHFKKQLKESYIFDEDMYDGEEMGDNEEYSPMHDEEHDKEMMQQGDSEEEKAMHANEVIRHEPIIGKIRETAIDGLKKYADNPTSSLYEFFKKVFLESDKVLTDNNNKN